MGIKIAPIREKYRADRVREDSKFSKKHTVRCFTRSK